MAVTVCAAVAFTFITVGYTLPSCWVAVTLVVLLACPPLLHETTLADIGLAIAATAVGCFGVWTAFAGSPVPAGCCTIIVAVLILVVVAAGHLLRAVFESSTVAAAMVCVATLAWLSWPIWTRTAPPLLVSVHPLLAVNGAVAADLGIWTEQPIAYGLTVLGQDVPYSLPGSIWPCISAHTGLATLLFAGCVAVRRFKRRPVEP